MNLSFYLNKTTKAAPLAVFRFLFGVMMFISIIRFWYNGWIETVYIQPKWFFTYYGFEFVKPLGSWTYLLFFICGISSIGLAVGYKYRISIITFFLSFTYIELIDKTPYLNHYYFVSLVAFVLMFLPANTTFSIDAYRKPNSYYDSIPKWCVDILKVLIGIVYVYAGIAKLNSDWLLHAQPLKIWLPPKYDLPIIGWLFKYRITPYVFSWLGMFYDLTIPFFLLYKPTRKFAFVAVVCFHMMTYQLFQIGMFPFIMTLAVLIYFSPTFHEKLVCKLRWLLAFNKNVKYLPKIYQFTGIQCQFLKPILIGFLLLQLILPWRYLLYPGELFWTEEGYRFSWRVMLVEKAGYTTFTIVNPEKGTSFEVRNEDFLSAFQIKQMSIQPDFMLQYAHMLRDHYIEEGIENPEVYAESYVTLNGRISQPFIDSSVDLAKEKESFKPKKWILPFNGTIKGL